VDILPIPELVHSLFARALGSGLSLSQNEPRKKDKKTRGRECALLLSFLAQSPCPLKGYHSESVPAYISHVTRSESFARWPIDGLRSPDFLFKAAREVPSKRITIYVNLTRQIS